MIDTFSTIRLHRRNIRVGWSVAPGNFKHPVIRRCQRHQGIWGCRGNRGNRGFTLLEVLLALGVFAVGFVFIAAIFPVAALLQKQAADDMRGQQVARNAEALLRGRVLQQTELENTGYGLPFFADSANYDTDGKIHRLPRGMLGGTPVAPTVWTLNDRSFPSIITTATNRKFFWVPLIMDTDQSNSAAPGPHTWQMYVFILQKRNKATYPRTALTGTDVWANPDDSSSVPGVRSVAVSQSGTDLLNFSSATFNADTDGNGTPDQIAVGDTILDNNGTIYSVTQADKGSITVDGVINPVPNAVTEIWFAPPGDRQGAAAGTPSDKPSPTVRILPLPNNTTDPIVQ